MVGRCTGYEDHVSPRRYPVHRASRTRKHVREKIPSEQRAGRRSTGGAAASDAEEERSYTSTTETARLGHWHSSGPPAKAGSSLRRYDTRSRDAARGGDIHGMILRCCSTEPVRSMGQTPDGARDSESRCVKTPGALIGYTDHARPVGLVTRLTVLSCDVRDG